MSPDELPPPAEETVRTMTAAGRTLRVRVRTGTDDAVPPLLLRHAPEMPAERGSYFLWDGSHRFTAASRAGLGTVPAWVAHVGGCCG